eukprot:TRINITY_DN25669_c0_g1_i1.p1 TRINITY_DN25669_c0_g1~~TRINITY_DN25669_c0_g1_i1.p1  ORF type:complete len:149 (-),score=11.83 TRINITY_DN25669_c0_g1_i1:71-517(-)
MSAIAMPLVFSAWVSTWHCAMTANSSTPELRAGRQRLPWAQRTPTHVAALTWLFTKQSSQRPSPNMSDTPSPAGRAPVLLKPLPARSAVSLPCANDALAALPRRVLNSWLLALAALGVKSATRARGGPHVPRPKQHQRHQQHVQRQLS